MPSKRVLIAGATGLVGYAALKHFGSQRDCEVIAVSRRQPDETFGARWHPLDLTDAAACARLVFLFSVWMTMSTVTGASLTCQTS